MHHDEFRCDMCGRVLERHGSRYVVSMSKLPILRGVGQKQSFDLCQQCASRLKVKLGRRDGYTEVK